MGKRIAIGAFVGLISFIGIMRAEDSPQWLGERRDGVYREAGIVPAIPKEGLKLRWKTPVGAGYAGPAISGGRVFLMDRVIKEGATTPAGPGKRRTLPGAERVLCLNEKDGRPLWTIEYDCPYTVAYPAGPRCTPAVDAIAGRIYALGTEGDLHCLDTATGKIIWHRKLEGPTPIWGFAGHPLIEGDKVIVTGSGKDGVIVAFDKSTGRPAWQALPAPEPGYSPPMIRTIHGHSQLIAWHPKGLASLDPATGAVNWEVEHGPVRNAACILSPILFGEDLLVLSSEFEGAAGFRVDPSGKSARREWFAKRQGRAAGTLCALVSPLAIADGLVVGINIDGTLRAINPADGKIAWETTTPTTGDAGPKQWYAAFITPHEIGGIVREHYIATESGDWIIAHLTAKGCEEVARTHLLDPTNTDARRPVLWSHPAYANQSIYWRNDKEIGCWWIGAEKTGEK